MIFLKVFVTLTNITLCARAMTARVLLCVRWRQLYRHDVLNCSHSESPMAAATAIKAEAFTNRDMAENNSANQSECEWP